MNTEKKSTRGGRRANSGRPKGSKDAVTIKGLLDALEAKSPNQSYEEMLVEDFLNIRRRGDSKMTIKYHNLILNKVLASKVSIDVTESPEVLENKRRAFAEALANLANLGTPNE
jgi:hypothetical protein